MVEVDPSYEIRHRIDKLMGQLKHLGWTASEIEEFVMQVVDEIREEEDEDDDDE